MAAVVPLFSVSTLNCRISGVNFIQSSPMTRCYSLQRVNVFSTTSSISPVDRRAAVPLLQRRLKCTSRSASGNGSGGVRGESGDGSGGDGGPDGGDAESKLLAGESEDTAMQSADTIVLDVGGMTCKGCSASVQRILESQPQVSRASVDLASETAVVWPVADAKDTPNWREELGEALAKHLTTCGFSSKVQGQSATENVPS